MSLLYDSHDSRLLREHKAASEAGLNGLQHLESQGNVKPLSLPPHTHTHFQKQPLTYLHYPHKHTSVFYFCYTFTFTLFSLFIGTALCFYQELHEVPERGKQVDFFLSVFLSALLYLFLYFIRMSFKWKDEHLHDNRLRSREGAPGRDSIHKQEPPQYLQYSSYGLTNTYIAQHVLQHCVLNMTIKRGGLAVCITILAG